MIEQGAGAVALIMAYVTAFYDRYRAANEKFYAYPDYYAFQGPGPLANYHMFDIFPENKLVSLPQDHSDKLTTMMDRGVNILLIPDNEAIPKEYDAIALASAQRNIHTCYAYTFDGQVENADLTIRCDWTAMTDWAIDMFDSVIDDPRVKMRKTEWLALYEHSNGIEQSFRRITLDEALNLI
jgi:hypothetical protein